MSASSLAAILPSLRINLSCRRRIASVCFQADWTASSAIWIWWRVANGRSRLARPCVGDAENQRTFAKVMGGGLRHLQMNHNAGVPKPETPSSQRARSLIFIAYGVLAATTLKQYHAGGSVTLYVCENGFISINPPLTEMRLGSLSTRTTHPVFFAPPAAIVRCRRTARPRGKPLSTQDKG